MAESDGVLESPDGQLVSALKGPGKAVLEQQVLPQMLPKQRWFGAKDSTIRSVHVEPLGELVPGEHALAVADVELSGETQRYLLPISARWDDAVASEDLASVRHGSQQGRLIDGALDRQFAKALMAAINDDRRLETGSGVLEFVGSPSLSAMGELGEARPLGAEQSNVSIAYGGKVILKLYRRLRAGAQPDVEVAKFLSDVAHFANTPEFLGEIRLVPGNDEATTLAAAFAFVPNQGDAWAAITEALTRDLGRAEFSPAVRVGEVLGRRTAEMHKALATQTDNPDFAVEPLSGEDVAGWVEEAVGEAERLLDQVQAGLARLPADARAIAEEVLGHRSELIARIKAAGGMAPSGGRSRIHGDYHLGQVLVADGDVMIIDFEGEPKRSLAERRAKSSPLRDVAGMLRSFDYAAWTASDRAKKAGGGAAVQARAEAWRAEVSDDFLKAYRQAIAGTSSYPDDPQFAQALTELFLLQKAIYEVGYELANRPDWIIIPLSGVRDLLLQPTRPVQA
jgi:trehalose synthase-fused probable maltokinase